MLIIDDADELMDKSLDDHNDCIVHIHGSLPPNVQVVVTGVNLANCSILDRIFKSEPIRIIGGSTDQVLTLEVRENLTVKTVCSDITKIVYTIVGHRPLFRID